MRTNSLSLVVVCAAACAALSGCAGSASSSGGESSRGDAPISANAVKGNCQIVMRTWDPRDPEKTPVTSALVNASSEAGRSLQTGRKTSTVVRVITDEQMGAVLAALDEKGFAGNSTPGIALETLRPDARRRGVIVVDRDGTSRGIEFLPNMSGTQIPTVYTECKRIIMRVHGEVTGLEVRASTDQNDDPSRIFQAAPIKPPRR
ncbi:MAG: hypothetical protein K8T90_13380 [Planctomycetes bacterium]|nr:hypothetical protein [Planctomycetota bacterium]